MTPKQKKTNRRERKKETYRHTLQATDQSPKQATHTHKKQTDTFPKLPTTQCDIEYRRYYNIVEHNIIQYNII